MRYIRILILVIIGLLQCNYGFAAHQEQLDGLTYEYLKYNSGVRYASLVGYYSTNLIPEDLTIPTTVKFKSYYGYNCHISEITAGALKGCTKFKSVNTNVVEEIKYNAFENCTSLQKVTLGVRCKKIGSKAFTGCTALDTINYVSGVTIAEDAFDETTYQNAKLIVDDKYRDECNSHAVWSKFKNKIYQYSISVYASYGRVSYNGVTVENDKRTSFVALEGSSITLSFMPEEGRELANLIIDGEDVTSKVVNNQYTIVNVSKSMDIQVSFFSITISAKGNGHVLCKYVDSNYPDINPTEYGDTRNGTNNYIVPKGYYRLDFYIYPDTGYQLSKVTKDGADITSDVNINYPIISSNIKYSATLEFTFEEIPPVMHTLSIKSIGNGSASYNGTSVRGGEKSYSIEEGSSPIISFAPDAGHRIKSVTVNGIDVTSSLSDNKYTIGNIGADTSLEVEFEPILHTLTISSSGFGEASYNGASLHDKTQTFSVVEGTSPTITFTPEAGYRIASVKLDGTDVTASVINNTYTIRNISADMTISVTFEAIPTYTLSVISSGNGSAYFNNTTIRNKTKVFTVNGETDATITFTPDDGYRIASVKLNGTDVTSSVVNNQYTISKISANTTIAVTFVAITHTLSVTASGNGSATYNNTTIRGGTEIFTVNEGASATVTFAPDAGYRISNVKVNGTDVTANIVGNKYTISSISANTTLAVVFEAIPITTYTFSISATGNGSVTYNGTAIRGKSSSFTVNEGASATVTFAPDAGYRIASVKLDDADVTSNVVSNQYTISNITANTKLAVIFEAIPPTTYTLSITASGNGTAIYNSTTVRGKTLSFTVNEGTSATITFAPDAGYKIANVKLNDADVTSSVVNNEYTISNITGNTTLAVAFEAIPPTTYTFSVSSSGNGSAYYNNTTVRNKTEVFTVNEGTSATVTFTPDLGYRIASVKLNNTDVTASVANNSYTISSITANTTLTVTFEEIPPITYALTISAVGNGTVTYDGNTVRGKTSSFTVVEGTNVVVTFSADDGNRLKSVKLGNTDVTSSVVNNQYTISNIKADTSLEVTFEAIPTYSLNITATGNGTATYNSTVVRGKTQTFTVNEGTSATITFAPDAGYRIASVKLDDADVTSSVDNNNYTISNITANTTLTVTFEEIPPTTYALTISAVGNGTVTYDGNTIKGKTSSFTVVEGTNVVVTFSADDGNRLKSVKLGNTDVTSSVVNNQYTISNIKANTSLEVTFEAIPTYSLNITASGNGNATYNGTAVRGKTQSFTVIEGTTATVTFAPDAGYRIASLKLNNTDVTASVANNSYTISNITANTTLAVTFEEIPPTTYALTISAIGNGTVTYDGNTVRGKTSSFTVVEGTNAVVTFSADDGNRLKSVKLGNTDVTSSVINNQYTISNIKANTSLEVTFEAIPTYSLNITASGNGSATYNSTAVRGKTQSFTVNEGTSATVTFTPDAGYRVASVKLNGTDVTSSVANGRYTISNIKSDNTLKVEFESIPPSTYMLNIVAVGNGSVSYNNTTIRNQSKEFTVVEESNVTITISPDNGYRLASVIVNDVDVTANVSNNHYTISNISETTNIEVKFEAITHIMDIIAKGNGTAIYSGTTIRDNNDSFAITEGSSASIRFTPDAGHKIKSVLLNDVNVTSDVINNVYTISNITRNNILEVEFEAIMHTLTIKATGNGSVSYNDISLSNQSKSFKLKEGVSTVISITPDSGYRIKSVTVNSTDMTSQMTNGQITISNIAQDTNVEVTFEAIPPTTYSLTITATGNGAVTYDGQSVRGGSSTFTVVEGSYATVQIAPDNGNRLKSVILDGKDVTADVVNDLYTTAKIMANTTLVVEFEEAVTELAYNGVNYKVVSYDEQKVNVVSGNYGLTLTVPATFEANGKTWTVAGIDNGALANAAELTAIIWEPEVRCTAEVSNPNLLLYVKNAEYAPATIQNVVVGSQAESIVLTEAAEGNNFYCPRAFTAQRISYSHNYSMRTGYQTCQGWETIVLPFDVTMITNAKGTELVPYVAWQDGSSMRPFWLYQLTESGWLASNAIKANVPYIISMPNNELYHSSYNQSGYIEFVGSNVQVATSDQTTIGQHGNKWLVANYQVQEASSSILALNVSNEWHQNTATEKEGSTFIRSLRSVHPFEAYMTVEGSNAPWAIPVFDNDVLTDIVDVRWQKEDGRDDDWYDLQGRKLQGEPKKNGIYLHNGKKVRK